MGRRVSYRSRDGTLKPRKQSQAGELSNHNPDSEDEDYMPVLSEEKMCNMQKMIKNPKQKLNQQHRQTVTNATVMANNNASAAPNGKEKTHI